MAVLSNSRRIANDDRAELDHPPEGPDGSDDYITGIRERHNMQNGVPSPRTNRCHCGSRYFGQRLRAKTPGFRYTLRHSPSDKCLLV
jgi:hypothetical protein